MLFRIRDAAAVVALLAAGTAGAATSSALHGNERGEGGTQPVPAGHLRISGTRFTYPDGRPFHWRGITAFRLVQMLARGRADEVEAYLDWCAARGLTIVRVLTMAENLFALEPEHGRAALPRLLTMAADRGLYVEIVALADTGAIPVDIDEHVREVGAIAGRHPNALVELANEPGHHTQAERVDDTSQLAKLAGLVPEAVPVALGSAEGDERFAGGDYATFHFPRDGGDRGWDHVAALAAGRELLRKWNKPVVNDEPIGAGEQTDPGRRDDNPDRFRASALVSRMIGLGATFHYEGGLNARIPSGRELECFEAWADAWRLLPDGIEHRGVVRQAGEAGAAVRSFDRRAALAVFERHDAGRAWVLVVRPAGANALQWSESWTAGESTRAGGVEVVEARSGG